MTIHATNQLEESTTQDCKPSWLPSRALSQRILIHCTDFMNYFQHGLDFLIDGDAHTVKKILLHTNTVRYSCVCHIAMSYRDTVAGIACLSAI